MVNFNKCSHAYSTLWQSPRRTDNFLNCWNSSFNLQLNLSKRNSLNHCILRMWFSSLSCVVEDPNKKFKDDAIAADKLATLSMEAMTALSTCLKARVTISWIQSDCMWGSFSASSTYIMQWIRFIRRHQHFSFPAKQRQLEIDEQINLTTRPKERICKPLRCMKSVRVRPSTGESSNDAKSVT